MKVLITTIHKGVFFGTLKNPKEAESKTVTITDARMCVYWSSSMKGVLGLASIGPDSECKIGPRVDEITLQDVTSLTKVSAQAVKCWEDEPWT
jgi:hypothetical protein